MNNIIQVVSVATAQKRREHIQTHFLALQVEFDFFDAITPREVNAIVSEHSLIFDQEKLTDGEKGCLLSHYLLWQKLVNGSDDYMIICEDDVILSSQIGSLLNELPNIMQMCDILKFETMKRLVVLSDDIISHQNLVIKKLTSAHMGTAGYVISKTMAKNLINILKNTNINKPIDHYMFDDLLKINKNIYQTIPAFAIQDDVLHQQNPNLISDLQSERRKKLNLAGRKYENKLVREFMRLFRPFSADYRAEKSFKKYLEKNGQIIDFKE